MNALLIGFAGLQSLVDAPVWIVLLLKATAVLFVAWLVHWAIARTNPRWRVLLWRITAVCLLVLGPIAWLLPALKIRVERSPTVPGPTTVAERPDSMPDEAIGHDDELLDMRDDPFDVAAGRFPPGAVEESSTDSSPAPHASTPPPTRQAPALAPAPPKPPLITTPLLLLAVWLTGVAILALRLCIGSRRIRRLVGRARPTPPWIDDECSRVARAVDCRRRVEVLQSTDVQSPFLCRAVRPRILLPVRMCDDAYRGDLPGILAHELTHVRSWDVPWNVGMQLVSILLWFHPLAWRIRKAHLAACELACDAVSANFVGNVSDYCRTLARVALDTQGRLPTAGIAMAGTSSIGGRLQALKRRVFHRPIPRQCVFAFGVYSLQATIMFGMLQLVFAAPPPVRVAFKQPEREVLRVRVVDPKGNSVAGATVHAERSTKASNFGSYSANRYETDARGIAEVALSKDRPLVRLRVDKEPFVRMISYWEQNERAVGARVPREHTIRLESGTTAGGRVVDEDGTPIAGARVEVALKGEPRSPDGNGRRNYDPRLAIGADAATTDAEGRWRIENVPNHAWAKLILRVSHPRYIFDERWGRLQRTAGATTAMLRDEAATLTLARGIVVQGRVTDTAGEPIKDAVVMTHDAPYNYRGLNYDRKATEDEYTIPASDRFAFDFHSLPPHKFPTDSDGRFRLPPLPPGKTPLTVISPSFAPQLRRVNLRADLPSQDFKLEPGKPIRLKIVDTSGKPVPDAHVEIIEWNRSCSLQSAQLEVNRDLPDLKIPRQTDDAGVWHWNSAPGEPVRLSINSVGPFQGSELRIAGGDPPRTVTLKPECRITGRVTDAVTGKPIRAFTVISRTKFSEDGSHMQGSEPGTDGRLDLLVDPVRFIPNPDMPIEMPPEMPSRLRLRIEADGYHPQTGPEVRIGDDMPLTRDFRLQPSSPVTGLVLDTAGRPAAKADVVIATAPSSFDSPNREGHKVLTDADGRFEFPDSGEPFSLIVRTEAGFALADFPADRRNVGNLRLQPWASVHGRFLDKGRPIQGIEVRLGPVHLDGRHRSGFGPEMRAVTDAEGRFEFPRAFSGPTQVMISPRPVNDKRCLVVTSVPLDLEPGQKVELDVGGAGTMLKGKVALGGDVPGDINYQHSENFLVCRAPVITPPAEIAKAGFDIRDGWRKRWHDTREGMAYLSTRRFWLMLLAPDGTFEISGVPAGDYDLAIAVFGNKDKWPDDPIARKVVRVTVSEGDVARGELTLPDIAADVATSPSADSAD